MGSITDEMLGTTRAAGQTAGAKTGVAPGSITAELLGYEDGVYEDAAPSGRTPFKEASLGDRLYYGIPFTDELDAAAYAALQTVFDGKDFGETYKDAHADIKAALGRYAKDHPIKSTVGEIAGALLTPVPGFGQASSVLGAVGRGAASGAVGGALAGAGDAAGGLGERAEGAVTGAVGGALAGGAVSGLLAGGGKVLNRFAARDLERLDVPETLDAYKAARSQGIKLTPGQATGLKTLQAEEKRLATRVPETMDDMAGFLGKQSSDAEDAFYRALDQIAPHQDAERTGRAVRKAAQGVLDDVLEARKTAARPLYERWAKESGPVETAGVLARVDDALKRAPRSGAQARTLKAIKGFLTDAEGKPVTDPAMLHNARIELSNILNTRSVGHPGTSLDNAILRRVAGIQHDLTAALDKASPLDDATGTPIYQLARGTFSAMSDDVDDAFGSALARIADLKDTRMLSTVREAFNPQTRSPEMVTKLRNELSRKDPAAWQSLKRLYLEDSVDRVLKAGPAGDNLNVAGKILAALNDKGTTRNLNAALNASEMSNLFELKFVLRKVASASLKMGSDTAANQEADRLARERAIPLLAKLARFALEPQKWGSRVADGIADANVSAQAKHLMRLVTSGDPEALLALRQLRQVTPSQWRSIASAGGKSGVAALDLAGKE